MKIKIDNNNEIIKWPYNFADLRADNPNISFPAHPTDALFEAYGVYNVDYAPEPEYDRLTHSCAQNSAPTLTDGAWTVGYTVTQRSEDDAADRVRRHRNGLLQETDQYALSDRTLSAAMAQYRSDLRAVPEQSGFPFDTTWPTKPSE
jgi:hypothetical protein